MVVDPSDLVDGAEKVGEVVDEALRGSDLEGRGDRDGRCGDGDMDRQEQMSMMHVAFEPIYGLIGFGVVGFGVDWWAGTGQLWTLILGGVGLLGGFYQMIRKVSVVNRAQSERLRRGHHQWVEYPVEDEGSEEKGDDWDDVDGEKVG